MSDKSKAQIKSKLLNKLVYNVGTNYDKKNTAQETVDIAEQFSGYSGLKEK